jgi:leader peptidase (prepilin peptidase) / N-methyltransferase
MLIIFWTLMGLAVGSFLNVVADRLPDDESIVSPPSHCGACERKLTALEMVPVVSFLALRGRCRTCGASIGVRVLWVELATGVLFAWTASRALSSDWRDLLHLVVVSAYFAVLIAVTVTDLEHGLILDKVIYPAIALALIEILLGGPQMWLSRVSGGAVGVGIIALIIWLSSEGMGWGDAKLAGFIGLITGWPGVGFALFLAFVVGGLAAGVLLTTGRKQRGQTVALGPFLAAGGAVLLLVGTDAALNVFHWLARLL